MQLSGNLPLNRYQWATQTTKDLIGRYYKYRKPVYYDVGAGENTLVKEVENQTVAAHAFDLAPLNSDVQSWNIESKFPYSHQPADIVTFLEIVEHLNNPWLCLKNIAGAMAPGGYLILTTPNPGWSTSRINLLLKGVLACFTADDLDLNHHVFIAWPHILERLLKDNGFEIVEYVTLEGPTKIFDRNIRLFSMLVQIPVRVIKKMIENADPSAIGMSYGVLARKINGTA